MALKNGTLGEKKYNDKEIAELQQTKVFANVMASTYEKLFVSIKQT